MSSFLERARELDEWLFEHNRDLQNRIRILDEETRRMDMILQEFERDHAYVFRNFEDDEITVAYTTGPDNQYYSDEEEDFMSDTETVVGDWEDPFETPFKRQRCEDVLIPDDLEDGLDFLNNM